MQAAKTMIDDRQRRRIFGAARGIGMDNDDLHALTADLTGKESLKALTAREAEALIPVSYTHLTLPTKRIV